MSEQYHGLSRIDPDAQELLPVLIDEASTVKKMDDEHAELYLFGETTSSWISPWQASELKIIKLASELANICKDDVVLDLGCGDGRVSLAMARMCGCKGIGWDSSEICIETAQKLRKNSGLEAFTEFKVVDFTKDVIQKDLDAASILFAYLPVLGLLKIRALVIQVCKKNPNVKLITNEYHFPDTENWEILAENGPIRISKPK